MNALVVFVLCHGSGLEIQTQSETERVGLWGFVLLEERQEVVVGVESKEPAAGAE